MAADKTKTGIYKSQYKANSKYEKEKTDIVRVRVPKGWKDQIKAYVEQSNKYSSINSMICELIKQEVGIDE